MDRTIAEIRNELERLEEKIGEVKRRLPAHSVKPPIMMELLELEDRRDVLLQILGKVKAADR
jgi:archaellum component FlaC